MLRLFKETLLTLFLKKKINNKRKGGRMANL